MREAVAMIADISVIIFAASSMLGVGLSYDLRTIIRPLRRVRAVFRALVANFILVPLLALVIERIIPLEPSHALGLAVLAGSAGTPFLVKLASAAGSDLALTAALLLLLIPVTVVFLPFYLALAMEHPAFANMAFVPPNSLAIGLPLLLTMILPIVVGLFA
jgi:BASS family bile acid:Na+ symporter